MPCGVDPLGFLERPMIEPQDDVPVTIKIWTGHGHWLIGVVREHGKRTCSIKADASDGRGIYRALLQSSTDRRADSAPDVGGRLLLEARCTSAVTSEVGLDST